MWLRKAALVILLIGFSQSSTGQQANLPTSRAVFVAKVVRIMDGDTMEVLYKNAPLKIRLAHIDCPEKRKSQPFGNDAKKMLSDLCFGQQVTVYAQKYDRYRRLIAVVINNQHQTVNQEMIKRGMAWHFKKYSKDTLYAQLEIDARKRKIGLWQEANPVAPWEWRKPKKLFPFALK